MFLGSSEPTCKKSGYLEASVLERPHRELEGLLQFSPQLFESFPPQASDTQVIQMISGPSLQTTPADTKWNRDKLSLQAL